MTKRQTKLDVARSSAGFERAELGPGAFVWQHDRFLDAETNARCFVELRETSSWEARQIVLFGRRVLQPRLVAWAGERPYRYSGQTLEPRALSPLHRQLLDRVSSATALLCRSAGLVFDDFNHLLLNRYRDGQDSMGYHADDEPELGQEPVVATLSLGAPRCFRIVPRSKQKHDAVVFERELGGGSLLIMAGRAQHDFRHGVPKQPKRSGERISVTFRHILSAPASS